MTEPSSFPEPNLRLLAIKIEYSQDVYTNKGNIQAITVDHTKVTQEEIKTEYSSSYK